MEDSDGYIFTILKPVRVNADGTLEFHDLDIFLGPDWVIINQEAECDSVQNLLKPIHAMEGRLRPDKIFYRICDGVVDS